MPAMPFIIGLVLYITVQCSVQGLFLRVAVWWATDERLNFGRAFRTAFIALILWLPLFFCIGLVLFLPITITSTSFEPIDEHPAAPLLQFVASTFSYLLALTAAIRWGLKFGEDRHRLAWGTSAKVSLLAILISVLVVSPLIFAVVALQSQVL